MVDRVLPDRVVFSRWLLMDHRVGLARPILEAYASGRLVDREAIDYVKGRDAGRLVDDRIAAGESNENEIDVVMAIVDAALEPV